MEIKKMGMEKHRRRNPKHYDGTSTTSFYLGEILPSVVGNIGVQFKERGDLIIASWNQLIGPKLGPMTQAVKYEKGILFVKVRNATLYSLLNQVEKPRLVDKLKKQFPKSGIRSIAFKIG